MCLPSLQEGQGKVHHSKPRVHHSERTWACAARRMAEPKCGALEGPKVKSRKEVSICRRYNVKKKEKEVQVKEGSKGGRRQSARGQGSGGREEGSQKLSWSVAGMASVAGVASVASVAGMASSCCQGLAAEGGQGFEGSRDAPAEELRRQIVPRHCHAEVCAQTCTHARAPIPVHSCQHTCAH